jgi:hypothetical protein
MDDMPQVSITTLVSKLPLNKNKLKIKVFKTAAMDMKF